MHLSPCQSYNSYTWQYGSFIVNSVPWMVIVGEIASPRPVWSASPDWQEGFHGLRQHIIFKAPPPLPSSASNLLFSLAYILFVVSITISLFLSAVPCVTAGAICYGSIGRYFAQIGIGPVNYIISDCWPDHLLAKSICYSDTCKSVSMLCGFLTVSSQYSTPWNHQVFICRCGEFRGTTPPLHPLPQHPDRHQALTKW